MSRDINLLLKACPSFESCQCKIILISLFQLSHELRGQFLRSINALLCSLDGGGTLIIRATGFHSICTFSFIPPTEAMKLDEFIAYYLNRLWTELSGCLNLGLVTNFRKVATISRLTSNLKTNPNLQIATICQNGPFWHKRWHGRDKQVWFLNLKQVTRWSLDAFR